MLSGSLTSTNVVESGSLTSTGVVEKVTDCPSVTSTAPPGTVSTGTSLTGLTSMSRVALEPVLVV